MRTIYYLSLLLLLIFPSSTWAQHNGVDQVLEQIDPSKGLKIDFTMTDLSVESGRSSGTYYAMGRSFYIEMPSLKAWYDGTNLWVYLVQNGEINLSKPTPEDLMDINPLTNVNRLKRKDYKVVKHADAKGYVFEAHPMKVSAHSTISSIVIVADKTYKPIKMTVTDRDLTTPLVVDVNKINRGFKCPAGLFTYDASKAPGVTVIDLR